MRYVVDPERSTVWVRARSTLHPISAESGGLEGFFEAAVAPDGSLDLRVAPRGRIELAVDRLSSGNPVTDLEMKRRIDAGRHRLITGEMVAMGSTGRPGRYTTEGEVTFRGVTRPAVDELEVSVPEPGTVVLQGEHVFDIRDFGMSPPRILMVKVHPDVGVRVRIVASSG